MRHHVSAASLLLLLAAAAAHAQLPEALWYIRNDERGIRSFIEHADKISIIAPQVFAMDSTGNIRGTLDPRIAETARAKGVKLVPLVMNPGFDQPAIHRVLTHPDARATALRSLAALCRDNRFDGIQFDYENFHVRYKDAFTSFAREAADSLHRLGCRLSAAVVPRVSEDRGTLPYHQWIFDNWRAAFDYKALADTLDFISYMTYAQHTGGSTPGPVAGMPWVEASLDYVLSLGVPPSKISLGVAAYSDYWFPHYDPRTGQSGVRGDDIPYTRAMEIAGAARVTPVWDDVQKAWYAMWERSGVFEHLWIEDARAFHTKAALVAKHRLRGYSVWLLGHEDPKTWEGVGAVAR